MRSNLHAIAAASIFLGIAAALPGEQKTTAPTTPDQPVVATRPAEALRPAARAVLSGVGIETGVVMSENARVNTALRALSGRVTKQSHPDALRRAFEAYYNYRAENPGKVRKPYLYFVDYGLDAKTPRGYVFDMNTLRVVDGPFNVAHGRGSGSKEGVPTRFTNVEGSATSSLGLYLTQEVYGFTGKAAGKRYTSVGLRMTGLSGRFNSAARQRRVVVHGAPYVGPGVTGRSEGCPAMDQARARKLLPKIGNGALVFIFSPRDRRWMQSDPWVHRAPEQVASAE
jgi:hypothetical protein